MRTAKVNCSLFNTIIQGFCFCFCIQQRLGKHILFLLGYKKNWIVWNKIFIIDSSSYLSKWIILGRLNIFMHVHVYIMNMKSSTMYIRTLYETMSKVQVSLEMWPYQCLHLAPTVQAKTELLEELHHDNSRFQDLNLSRARSVFQSCAGKTAASALLKLLSSEL